MRYHPSQAWRFCGNWDGVASVRWDVPWSATKRRSGDGSSNAGRKLKKSPKRRPYHRLHRRKWIERAPAPLPYLGAAGTNAGAAISLQLEDAIGHGGVTWRNFYFRLFPGHSQPADHRVSLASAAPHSRQVADRLGRNDRPSQPHDLAVHPQQRGRLWVEFLPAMRRSESGRVPVVALEATRATQFLPAELWPVKPLRP